MNIPWTLEINVISTMVGYNVLEKSICFICLIIFMFSISSTVFGTCYISFIDMSVKIPNDNYVFFYVSHFINFSFIYFEASYIHI